MYVFQINIPSLLIALLLHLAVLSGFFMYFDPYNATVRLDGEMVETIASYLYEPPNKVQVNHKEIERTPSLNDMAKSALNEKKPVQKIKKIESKAVSSKHIKAQSKQNNGEKVETLTALLHLAIQNKQQYPLSALNMGREGRVKLAFSLFPSGSVTHLVIAKSSGTKSLDLAALNAVREAEPFKDAINYLTAPQHFSIDVVFELDDK